MCLKIALSKGYLLDPALYLFQKAGINVDKALTKSRKLSFFDKTGNYEFVIIRPADVPVFVEHGAVDIGIVGKDVLTEGQYSLAELLDLKFGYCKLVLASLKDNPQKELFQNVRIATKFVNTTKMYCHNKGINAEIIKLYGSVELAPKSGLADMIVDLTATGKTLMENDLEIFDTILESTARLVSNKIKLKVKYEQIMRLLESIQRRL